MNTRPAHPLIPLHGLDLTTPAAPQALPIELHSAPRPAGARAIAAVLLQHRDVLALSYSRLINDITDKFQCGRTTAARALQRARAAA